jgi:hypothetical protein
LGKDDNVEIRYTLKPEDYAEANRQWLLNTTRRRKVSYYFMRSGFWIGIPLLGLAIAGFVLNLYAPWYGLGGSVSGILAIVAWAGAICIICRFIYQRKIARLFREQKLSREILLKAEESGLLVARTDGTSETRFTWEAFDKAVESEQAFILFPSARTFLPVPKRAMDPTQEQEFRALLAAHVPGTSIAVAAVS